MDNQEKAACQTQPKRKHLSASQIKAYERCGYWWELKYIQKKKFPPPLFMVKGTAVHYGAEVNFKQKIQTRQDLDVSKMKEAAASAFEERIKSEGVQLSDSEADAGLNISKGRAKDSAVSLVEVFARDVAPIVQPKMVEEKHTIRISDEYDMQVVLDVITEDEKIRDLKTSKRAWNQKQAAAELQFWLYQLAFRAIFKKDPAGIVVDNLVDLKTPKHVGIEMQPKESNLKKAIEKINLFLFGVNEGVFLPAPRGSWYCSDSHCPAAHECKYFQFYKRGGGKQPLPFWMKFKKKKTEEKNVNK